ncbi:hypothetical protein [Kitasatospora sp. A2-31]|uniref:hypothetical protein n=1 Tax=Kitasatospora sp. A2-31 TaxID=2916414 RepID=UPI001EEA56CB|nr:hypothetical protein [Kitasatospora sp. A2-31]MCG6495789.1 hypothetical protein [Kitasatospora sp. A2-31]
MIEFLDSDIGIPEGLGPFYLPEDGDVAYVSEGVFGGAQVESVFLDDEGDIQAFSGEGEGPEPRLVHYSHIAQANPHLAGLPRMPLEHWAVWDAGKNLWRVMPA